MQQLVGRFLGRNWLHIPHVTHHDEIDVTDVEIRRVAWNTQHPEQKTSLVAPVIKALALSLKVHPQFASSLDPTGGELLGTRDRQPHNRAKCPQKKRASSHFVEKTSVYRILSKNLPRSPRSSRPGQAQAAIRRD